MMPPPCGCDQLANRLCLRAARLRARLQAEWELATENGDFTHYRATFVLAEEHVAAMQSARAMRLPADQADEVLLAKIRRQVAS